MCYHVKTAGLLEDVNIIMRCSMFKIVLLVILLFLPSLVFGEVDPLAVKSADFFLKGIKLIDLPEGKKMISNSVWYSNETYPVYTESSTVFEDMFQTDHPDVTGYKKFMEIKVVSKGGTPLLKKYLLISYKDQSTNQWKVYDFMESHDAEYEAQQYCKNVETLSDIERKIGWPLKFKYLGCGQWSASAGKLIQAKNAFIKASELNEHTEKRMYRDDPLKNIEVIKKILGEYK